MRDLKKYFAEHEERVSNTYMSASGEPHLQKPPFSSKYRLEIYLLKAVAVLGVIGYIGYRLIKK